MDKNSIHLDEHIKKIIELVHRLRKIDVDEFKEHIERVRQSSDIQILPYLVELLADEQLEEEKKEAIYGLIMDVKHPKAADLLCQSLRYVKGTTALQPYLAALWQNSISFADHLDIFVEIVLTADYLTAYDAFTVIENSAHDATPQAIEHAIETLKNGLASQDDSKKPMISELIKVLVEFRQ